MKLSTGSGLPISQIALGTWTFAGDKIWGDSDRSQSIRVIHAALDQGINLFDTAPNYGDGRSEEILGEAFTDQVENVAMIHFEVWQERTIMNPENWLSK